MGLNCCVTISVWDAGVPFSLFSFLFLTWTWYPYKH